MNANTPRYSTAADTYGASANSSPYRGSRRARLLVFVVLLLMVTLLGLAALNRNNLFDWMRLRNYQAPAAIAQLAVEDGMTNYAKKLFYINHPQLDGKASFNQACPNGDATQSIVLGCYHSNQQGIFLLNVTDPRLQGVEQVTAAHETLHSAYDRLSGSQRRKIDTMLNDYYRYDLTDQTIKNEIAIYQKTEPRDVTNEMHSVFGTEVAQLPAPLEQYYKTLFTNRAQIVAYANQYQAEFTSRQATVSQDDAQLSALQAQILSGEASLKTKLATINAEQQTLAAQRSTNVTAYNAAVPGFNALVDSYDQEVRSVQALVTQYNQLVVARNAVALQENQLTSDLTATLPQVSP